MQNMKYLKLLRLDHTFKSIFIIPGVFYALFFIENSKFKLFNLFYVLLICQLVSSANYVINEFYDKDFDRFHPIKKFRPSVVFTLDKYVIFIIYFGLLSTAFLLSLLYSYNLFILSLIFALAGFMYNIKPFRFKDLPILDVMWESINNPIRFIYGIFIVNSIFIYDSTILFIILSYWFFGCYLMTLKRFSELHTLATKSDYKPSDYRKSFSFYTKNNLLSISLYYAIISNYLISHILYSINIYLFYFFPILALLFPYYFILSFNNDSEVQNPEKLHKNKVFLFTIVIVTLIFSFLYIYKNK
jgi:4-hydroxybenzoate polyprenyltransferase